MGSNAHYHYLYYRLWLPNTSCTYGTTFTVYTYGPEWAHVRCISSDASWHNLRWIITRGAAHCGMICGQIDMPSRCAGLGIGPRPGYYSWQASVPVSKIQNSEENIYSQAGQFSSMNLSSQGNLMCNWYLMLCMSVCTSMCTCEVNDQTCKNWVTYLCGDMQVCTPGMR
jgi:hypothetical protein